MLSRHSIWLSGLIVVFLLGCVSKNEFNMVDAANKEKIKTLGKQIEELKKEKVTLNNQVKTLQKTIQKKEVVISIQGKVIKLIDDPNQTLQKSIEAQIAAQNVEK